MGFTFRDPHGRFKYPVTPSPYPFQLSSSVLQFSKTSTISSRLLTKCFSIYCFWEQFMTSMNYGTHEIVERESAIPLWTNHEQARVDVDHSHLRKFSATSDAGFKFKTSSTGPKHLNDDKAIPLLKRGKAVLHRASLRRVFGPSAFHGRNSRV